IDPDTGTPYLIMDYAPEGSLRQRHPRRSRLAPSRALVYAEQVAQALDYAHHEHIIHRDVKPENMLIGPRGEILLSDFGIATLVANPASQSTPTIAGTWAYMAPEQFQGHPLPASDQYSLAVVVYEWLCGERPFRGEPLQIMTQHLQANPPPLRERNPAISPALEEAVHIALAKNPAQRYPTVSDFTTALRLALNPTRPIPNPPPPRPNTTN